MKKLLALILSSLTLLGLADSSTKLSAINSQITQLQTLITNEKTARQEYQRQLAHVETKSASLSQELSQTQLAIQEKSKHLASLSQQISADDLQYREQQEQLNALIRQAYQIGTQPLLKILLDQSSLEHSQRMLVYYRYLSMAQAQLISSIENILKKLQAEQQNLQATAEQLQNIKTQQATQERQFEAAKEDRLKVIAQLDQRLQTRQEKLNDLIANRQFLEHTLQQLSRSPSYNNQGEFSANQGKLNWPAMGKIINLYSTPIEQSELKWEGILIEAPEDTAVHAVANGKVLFAKWMPGYGLLMIINNGNGYMTLYGRNHALYKQVGDSVKAGDVIAGVGKTGGYDQSALYFAIRHDAKSLDPMQWCHS